MRIFFCTNKSNNQLYFTLQVEELQLRSAIITQKQRTSKTISKEEPSTSTFTPANPNDKFDSVALINEQNLNLESIQGSHSDEEFED